MLDSELRQMAEDLQAMSAEQLISLVLQLQEISQARQQALDEVAHERDAALLLNELCHY